MLLNRVTSAHVPADVRALKAIQEQANKLQSKMKLELAGVQDQRLDQEAQERYYINPQIDFYDGNFASSRSDGQEAPMSDTINNHENMSGARSNDGKLNEDI